MIGTCFVVAGSYRSSSALQALAASERIFIAHSGRLWGGTIGTFRAGSPSNTQMSIHIDRACSARARQECEPINARAILVVRDSSLARRLVPGASIRFRGTASPFLPGRNPGAFNYSRYLKHRGFAVELSPPASDSVSVSIQTRSLAYVVFRARERVRRHLEASIISLNSRAVLSALLLGDRSGIDETVQAEFRNTGLMHLLAVSGLHVLVIGYSLYGLIGTLLTRLGLAWVAAERIRVGTTILIIVAYYFLAGQSTSIFRALIMATSFLLQHVFRRRAMILNSLGIAALIVLWVNPFDLFSVGFQLSFAAVASLVLLSPLSPNSPVPNVLGRWAPVPLRAAAATTIQSITSSFSVTLGTLPVLIYHFGYVSLAGIVLNVIAIPLTAGALSSGILAVLASEARAEFVASWFGSFADTAILVLIRVTHYGNRVLNLLGFDIGWPQPLLAGLFGCALLFYALRRALAYRWRSVIAMGSVAVALNAAGATMKRPSLDLVFLDIGQGDAIVVRTPENRTMIIDVGPPPYRLRATEDRLRNVFQMWGVTAIDAILLTHPHSDHIGGLRDVTEAFSVRTLIDNGVEIDGNRTVDYNAFESIQRIERTTAARGATIQLSPSTTLEVLSPDSSLLRSENVNDASVVVRIVFGSTCALLTGDIEAAAERHLIRRYKRGLRCDVVKIPHHGSNTSSGIGFVASTTYRHRTFAVASVAKRNRFGLPDEEALDRWVSQGARVRTTQSGAVWLRSDGLQFFEVEWR
ncbi:MAG: DNA internalization-related competence protein ComEC/Rec2 [Rhodothermales bacterium]|nr:DNA internalization-related competence protein ComEC/Rec2 [Rhodothermales bacterium]